VRHRISGWVGADPKAFSKGRHKIVSRPARQAAADRGSPQGNPRTPSISTAGQGAAAFARDPQAHYFVFRSIQIVAQPFKSKAASGGLRLGAPFFWVVFLVGL